MFGPVEFHNLHQDDKLEPYDYEKARSSVVSVLSRSALMPSSICIHGFKVKCKNRNLKRRSSILKHGRFLRNLEVVPNLPPPKTVKEVVEEDE